MPIENYYGKLHHVYFNDFNMLLQSVKIYFLKGSLLGSHSVKYIFFKIVKNLVTVLSKIGLFICIYLLLIKSPLF